MPFNCRFQVEGIFEEDTMFPMLILAAALATGPGPDTPMTQDEAVQLAKQTVQDKLKGKRDPLSVSSVQAMDWSDSSLGCPKPGMMYAQMIVPGFKVVIQSGDAFYPVHVGGGHAVLCMPPRTAKRDKDAVSRANQIFTAREKLAAQLNVSVDQIQVVRPGEMKNTVCKPEVKKHIRLAYQSKYFAYDPQSQKIVELQCAPVKSR